MTPKPIPRAHARAGLLPMTLAVLVALAALAGCGGGTEDTDTAPPQRPGDPPAGDRVAGELRAPQGVTVRLQLDGTEELLATVGGSAAWGTQAFAFASARAPGQAYTVGITGASQGQTCSVYRGATGTVPPAAGALKVGCIDTWEHVSRNASARGTPSTSGQPVVGGGAGAEGRYVAFVSSDARLTGVSGGVPQILWRDRETGLTRVVSTDAAGNPGDNTSTAPAISADGLTVVFESAATNLVAGDTNGRRDVFLWSAAGGLRHGVERVSVAPGGAQADGDSLAPSVSGNGRVVAWHTNARNLVPGVETFGFNVVRRDRTADANTVVSRAGVGLNTGRGTGGAWAALSDDGNRLAFWSIAADLVAGDTNGIWDIFVYQHDSGSLRRVSLGAGGAERNAGTESGGRNVQPALSGNGRYVAYATTASNVVPGDTNGAQDVFVVDLDDPAGLSVRRVTGPGGVQGDGDSPKDQGERPGLSADGRHVAFTTNAASLAGRADQVVMVDLASGELRVLSPGSGTVYRPMLSRSGATAVFGANRGLDPRFDEAGVFAHHTGVARAWTWVD